MSHPDPSLCEIGETSLVNDVRHIVVVGGGPAAHRCVVRLRKTGFDGLVTLISSELISPYDRTLLSKNNLLDGTSEIVTLASPGLYEELDIQLCLGAEAVALNASDQSIELADGSSVGYDRLVLAVGGTPILPQALAAPGVLTMRTSVDVAPVRDALERSRHVVVIGGGFIGGEIAAAATAAGCGVTLIEADETPLQHALGPEVGKFVADLHVSRGVDVRCRVHADSVCVTADGYRVELNDGSSLQCDSVVVGVGMRPSIDWLRSSGIEIQRAIITDSACRTSIPGVFAAGDCAEWWSPRYGTYCHIEHWDTAGKHGSAAAYAVVGLETMFNPVPFFWSDQYDVKYQWAGYAPQCDTVEIEGEGPDGFIAKYMCDGRMTGVFAANKPKGFGQLRKQLLENPGV